MRAYPDLTPIDSIDRVIDYKNEIIVRKFYAQDQWGPKHSKVDFDGDGTVTFPDLSNLRDYFNTAWNEQITATMWDSEGASQTVTKFYWDLCLTTKTARDAKDVNGVEGRCDPTPYYASDPFYYDQDNNKIYPPEDYVIDSETGKAVFPGSPDTVYYLDETTDLDLRCVELCKIGYHNDKGPDTDYRQNIRMWYLLDAENVNTPGIITFPDLNLLRDNFNKGHGLRYTPGFQRVDYNGDGWVSPDEVENAKTDGRKRCNEIWDNTLSQHCFVCDDSEDPQKNCQVSEQPQY